VDGAVPVRAHRQAPTADDFEALTWALIEMGRGVTASDYLVAVAGCRRFPATSPAGRGLRPLAHASLAEPPLPWGPSIHRRKTPLRIVRAAGFVPFTPICNITGQPAMNVPLYWTRGGSHRGTVHRQVRGRGHLFRLAAQLEVERPWPAGATRQR